jgi:hypothetical protein
MPLLDQERTDSLIALAKGRFDSSLLPAEVQVIRRSASSEDSDIVDSPQSRPQVRPDFLRWLSTDREAADAIDAKGIRIVSATISGQLDLSFCRISPVLVFHFCTFQEEVLLLHSDLRGLFIYGSMASAGIVAHGAIVRGPLFLGNGFQSSAAVDFHGARIEGGVQCTGAFLAAHGYALSLEGGSIQGDVFLANGFRSCAEVRLLGAKIRGDLNCDGASLSPVAGGKALSLDRASIGGNVFFTNLRASATLSLPGAQIGGELNCTRAIFAAHDNALVLDGATINGGVVLQNLRSSGKLRFVGCHIVNGGLDCSNAVLAVQGLALELDRANIQGSVFFRRLKSSGAVRMTNAQIEHNLDCRGADIAGLSCRNMRLGRDLIWTSIQNPKQAQLNIASASLGKLSDDEGSWPSPGNLILDGLLYEELSLHPTPSVEQLAANNLSNAFPLDAAERIAWLRLQSLDARVEPQPWMQLSKLLDAKGDRKGARHVIFALRREQADVHGSVLRFLRTGIAWLEENPLRVLWLFAILAVVGTLVFWRAERVGAMAPTDKDAYAAWAEGKPFQSAYPRFNPIIYAVEDALPLVRLGQDEKWAPDPSRPPTCYWFLAGSRWLLMLFGWVLATLLAAAIGDRFKR